MINVVHKAGAVNYDVAILLMLPVLEIVLLSAAKNCCSSIGLKVGCQPWDSHDPEPLE